MLEKRVVSWPFFEPICRYGVLNPVSYSFSSALSSANSVFADVKVVSSAAFVVTSNAQFRGRKGPFDQFVEYQTCANVSSLTDEVRTLFQYASALRGRLNSSVRNVACWYSQYTFSTNRPWLSFSISPHLRLSLYSRHLQHAIVPFHRSHQVLPKRPRQQATHMPQEALFSVPDTPRQMFSVQSSKERA